MRPADRSAVGHLPDAEPPEPARDCPAGDETAGIRGAAARPGRGRAPRECPREGARRTTRVDDPTFATMTLTPQGLPGRPGSVRAMPRYPPPRPSRRPRWRTPGARRVRKCGHHDTTCLGGDERAIAASTRPPIGRGDRLVVGRDECTITRARSHWSQSVRPGLRSVPTPGRSATRWISNSSSTSGPNAGSRVDCGYGATTAAAPVSATSSALLPAFGIPMRATSIARRSSRVSQVITGAARTPRGRVDDRKTLLPTPPLPRRPPRPGPRPPGGRR